MPIVYLLSGSEIYIYIYICIHIASVISASEQIRCFILASSTSLISNFVNLRYTIRPTSKESTLSAISSFTFSRGFLFRALEHTALNCNSHHHKRSPSSYVFRSYPFPGVLLLLSSTFSLSMSLCFPRVAWTIPYPRRQNWKWFPASDRARWGTQFSIPRLA